jgi:hypothetical protein
MMHQAQIIELIGCLQDQICELKVTLEVLEAYKLTHSAKAQQSVIDELIEQVRLLQIRAKG